MKKIILICLALTVLGCKSMSYQGSQIKIGMPENEFKQANRSAELMLVNHDGTSIYRILTYEIEPYSFFYFYEGKLTRFVKSDRKDDWRFIR